MNLKTEFVTLNVSDGTKMRSYVSQPSEQKERAGIILFQEAFGVNHHIRNVADRLANEGYCVIAPELFHRTAEPGLEIPYTEFSKTQDHFKGINIETLEADSKAAFDWLRLQENVTHQKIASIGFCLGGRASFVANTSLPLSAAVSFYGGGMHLITNRVSNCHSPQLFFWGGLDKHILPEHIEQVVSTFKNENKPYTNVVISNADHAFHCDERGNYNEHAAKEAWAMTIAFLKNNLG